MVNPIVTARESVGCKNTADFLRSAKIGYATAYKAEQGIYGHIPSPYLLGLIDLGYPGGQVGQLKLDYLAWLEKRKAAKS